MTLSERQWAIVQFALLAAQASLNPTMLATPTWPEDEGPSPTDEEIDAVAETMALERGGIGIERLVEEDR